MEKKTLKELAREKGFRTATSLQSAIAHSGELISLDSVRSHLRADHEPLPFFKKVYMDFFKVSESEINWEKAT